MKTEIRGVLSTKTDLVVKEAAEIGGIIASGTVDVSGVSGGVRGDVHAHGDTVIESDVGGDVIVDGDVTVKNEARVDGEIKASGTITLLDAGADDTSANTDVSNILKDPIEPSIPSFKSATDLIKDKETKYQTNGDNDNADKPGLIDNSASAWDSFACSSSCSLDDGGYYIEGLHFSGDLTIDTNGGDVHVFVDDYVNIQGTITVEGNGQLFIYLDGDNKHGLVNQHFAIDGTVETRDDIDGDGVLERSYNATKVWTYVEPDSSVGFSTHASYTGVLYGADDSGTGTDYSFSNHANVFGAVIGVLDDFNNHPAIHYDERLASAAASPAGGGSASGSGAAKPNVIHIEASERTVEVS
jgi:cytoskeletal protein CcmA (bactofilin family)